VTALARGSDAIIMDLRSFSRQNNGCIFEIRTLTATVSPNRIVFLVDQSTDLPALEEVFQHARWPGNVAKVFRLDEDSQAATQRVIAVALDTLRERSGNAPLRY
jgi:hypothetical protein